MDAGGANRRPVAADSRVMMSSGILVERRWQRRMRVPLLQFLGVKNFLKLHVCMLSLRLFDVAL